VVVAGSLASSPAAADTAFMSDRLEQLEALTAAAERGE
jgi:hypothetical protein